MNIKLRKFNYKLDASIDQRVTLDAATGKSTTMWLKKKEHKFKYILSGSRDSTIKVWDYKTAQCVQTLAGHGRTISCMLVMASTGEIASASFDSTIKLWNIVTGECVKTLRGHSSWVIRLLVQPATGLLLSASLDRTIKVWNIRDTAAVCLHTLDEHQSGVNIMHMMSTGFEVASASGDAVIKIWNVNTGECLHTLLGHTKWINALEVVSRTGHLVSASRDKTIRVWDPSTGACVRTLEGHQDGVWCLLLLEDHAHAAADDELIVSGSLDHTIRIWSCRHGVCLHTLLARSMNCSVYSLLSITRGRELVCALEDGRMQVWCMRTFVCLKSFKYHTDKVRSVRQLVNTTDLVSCSDDHTIRVWDMCDAGFKLTKTLQGHADTVTCFRSFDLFRGLTDPS